MGNTSRSQVARVIVVHGDDATASEYCAALRLWGFDPTSTPDAERALTMIADLDPAAVVLDLSLPGLDPLDLAMALRAHPPTSRVAIVALSESLADDALELAIARGCDRVLGLFTDADELSAEVESAAARSAQRYAA